MMMSMNNDELDKLKREHLDKFKTDQIIDLYANGVKNVHVYTMNKPDVARKILENLSEILG